MLCKINIKINKKLKRRYEKNKSMIMWLIAIITLNDNSELFNTEHTRYNPRSDSYK